MHSYDNKSFNLRFVIAFLHEANPVIKYYDLRFISENNALYKVYANKEKNIWLVISGIGNINSASASTFLYTESPKSVSNIWVNIGIGGHAFIKPSSIFHIKKVSSYKNKNESFYTNSIINEDMENYEVLSVDEPENIFSMKNKIYEMEALGFIKIVEKFCNRELICIIKIISDNGKVNVSKLKSYSTKIIESKMICIHKLLSSYIKLGGQIREYKHSYLSVIENKFNLSFTNKFKVNKLLSKLKVIEEDENINKYIASAKNLKSLIIIFEKKLKSYKLKL